MEVISLSKARSRLSELHRQIVCNHAQVILTHKSGNAVLVYMNEIGIIQRNYASAE